VNDGNDMTDEIQALKEIALRLAMFILRRPLCSCERLLFEQRDVATFVVIFGPAVATETRVTVDENGVFIKSYDTCDAINPVWGQGGVELGDPQFERKVVELLGDYVTIPDDWMHCALPGD
jgi:hypothetical protein